MSTRVLLQQDDPRFPREVLQARPQPQALWAEGDLSLLERPLVAVVGSRTPSVYGTRMAYQAARDLAQAGVVVVSGLARGLDARAHRGALDGGGGTIAVLGCGLDVVYPPQNRELHHEIAEHGLILSEYAPETRPAEWTFPARNRIIAALARCLLVIEGKPQGGTSNTVEWTQKMGKQILAVPGHVGEAEAEGPNLLIQQGAHLYLTADDVLDVIGLPRRPAKPREPSAAAQAHEELSGAEATLFDLVGPDPVHVDVLAAKSALEPGLVLAALSVLELQGLVTQLPGKHFALAS